MNSQSPSPWDTFAKELDSWSKEAHTPKFWLRDDDATQEGYNLSTLIDMCVVADIPPTFAAIPACVKTSLISKIQNLPVARVFQHGYAHTNYAPTNEKKAEYGYHRPIKTMTSEISKGWHITKGAFGSQALAVFVPPWNRITEHLLPHLPAVGFNGFSSKGTQISNSTLTSKKLPLKIEDAHIDIVNWKKDRSFIGDDAVITRIVKELKNRRLGIISRNKAICLLTHHKVMGQDSFDFLKKFWKESQIRGVKWISPKQLFGNYS